MTLYRAQKEEIANQMLTCNDDTQLIILKAKLEAFTAASEAECNLAVNGMTKPVKPIFLQDGVQQEERKTVDIDDTVFWDIGQELKFRKSDYAKQKFQKRDGTVYQKNMPIEGSTITFEGKYQGNIRVGNGGTYVNAVLLCTKGQLGYIEGKLYNFSLSTIMNNSVE